MANVYSNSPLSEISLQLKFADFYNIEDNIPKFNEKIKYKFPHSSVEMEPKISINITNQNGEIKTTHQPSSWVFHETKSAEDSPIIIEISKNNCILDFRVQLSNYEGFNSFKNDYISLLVNALSVFEIKEVSFIGLRYINNIICKEGNPLYWKNIVSDALLLDKLLENNDSTSRLMTEFTFEKNDFFINFHFGIFNKEFPNPIARKEFTLDFDCICNDEINIHEIDEIVDEMHETISELFEENITDEYRKFIE